MQEETKKEEDPVPHPSTADTKGFLFCKLSLIFLTSPEGEMNTFLSRAQFCIYLACAQNRNAWDILWTYEKKSKKSR